MIALLGSLAGLMLYLEVIYHLGGFGLTGGMPVYVLGMAAVWSGIWTLIIGLCRGVWKKRVFYAVIWFYIFWAAAQFVYLKMFRQPLLWESIFWGGQDALTQYWREALEGIFQVLPFLFLFLLPGILTGVWMRWRKVKLPRLGVLQILRLNVVICLGIVSQLTVMEVGKTLDTDYYESYLEFYDPFTAAQKLGFLPVLQRDTHLRVAEAGQEVWEIIVERFSAEPHNIPERETLPVLADVPKEENKDMQQVQGDDSDEAYTKKHEMPIDFGRLYSLAEDERKGWLTHYIEGLEASSENEYTGLFEGCNLIFLTAEGFSPYGVREDLTPTLYRLTHSGFMFENYYVPLWQTSTSDGEYINCTGLIPDGQFSMRKSASNEMPFALPGFFAQEGVDSLAYHNNSLSYYDRYRTHPNLGYDFKGCRLGRLSGKEWEEKLFAMENPDAWPPSDLEMMRATVPEYIEKDRFHVYYMTISGHMNYNFSGNAMAAKNKEAVEQLQMSESAKAYIACSIELDKALEYLLEQLEAAGKLDKTVICLSADHYPYGMTDEQYQELAGIPLSEGMDMYRNSLILWSSQMEEPVVVKKVCGPMDILPTLLNLFGFSYDSRMYAGRDILSEEEGLVIFNDRSFVTDSVIYNRREGNTIWLVDEQGNPRIPEEEQGVYFSEKEQEVRDIYQFSAYVLQTNYYSDILEAVDSQ